MDPQTGLCDWYVYMQMTVDTYAAYAEMEICLNIQGHKDKVDNRTV